MTPPVAPVAAAAAAAVAATPDHRPFRYLAAALLIGFAMAVTLILAWFKQPIGVADVAIVLPALLFGIAFASESVFTFVVTKAAPFAPFARRKDD